MDIDSVLEGIGDFIHTVTQNDRKIVIKCNVENYEDAKRWIREFGFLTRTQWIVDKQRQKSPQKYILHKQWVCHHNSRNKVSISKRNVNCKASIDILVKKVNRHTRRNDNYLNHSPPLCATITANLNHNHSIDSFGSLKYLRATDSVKRTFERYFDSGLGPAEAISAHENSLLLLDNYTEAMANGAINPISRTVYHLHANWKEVNSGTVVAPLVKLKDKIASYAKEEIFVAIKEEHPWAVLVVTDLMKRAQNLASSEEMIFLDSSASSDSTQSTVTTVLTVTKAGAIPIGIIIHETQSTEGYTAAFSMLAHNFPHCFGGKTEPKIFMTDDSSSQKAALLSVWPGANQLLCHFHMAQAEWRWLISLASGVNKNQRKPLMELFQKVMYAESTQHLAEALAAVDNLDGQDKFVSRLHKNLERKEEWILFYRNQLIPQHDNTNTYYAEATMRVLKDVVLCRTKAFNVVALVEFCSTIWNKYFIDTLLNFAHERRAEPLLGYTALCHRMRDIDQQEIKQIDDVTFSVPSGSTDDQSYIIDVKLGVCSCPAGCEGRFCKHQAILHEHLDVMLPNVPPINLQERYELAKLALGNKCPPRNSFKGLEDTDDVSVNNSDFEAAGPSMERRSPTANIGDPTLADDIDMSEWDDFEMQRARLSADELSAEMSRIQGFLTPKSTPHLEELVKNVSKIQNETDLISALIQFNKSFKSSRKGGKIRVQPTSRSGQRIRKARQVILIDKCSNIFENASVE